jgi:hypothetical protein
MQMIVVDNVGTLWGWLKETIKRLDWKYKYVVTIKRYRANRSLKQNKLYWVLITAIADNVGDDKKSIHLAYKKKLAPVGRKRPLTVYYLMLVLLLT